MACIRYFAWVLAWSFAPLVSAAQEPRNFGCLVDPYAEVDLSTRESGTIRELLVDRGDAVEKGDVVARLDDEVEAATVDLAEARAQMQAEIEEAQASLELAERELERTQALLRMVGLIPEVTLGPRVRVSRTWAPSRIPLASSVAKIALSI